MRISDFDLSAKPKTLYVSRKLLNGDDLRAWAKDQGLVSMLPSGDLHVTIAHSKVPVVWEDIERVGGPVTVEDGLREIDKLGKDESALVLRFSADDLSDRWQELCDAGCYWKWPDYRPHITLSYTGGDIAVDGIEPYDGPLEFGPEIFAEIDDDWSDEIVEEPLTEQMRQVRIASGWFTIGGDIIENEIRLWHNPLKAEFLKALDSIFTMHGDASMRGIAHAGQVWLWEAEKATHHGVLVELGFTELRKSDFDYTNPEFAFFMIYGSRWQENNNCPIILSYHEPTAQQVLLNTVAQRWGVTFKYGGRWMAE